MKAVLNGPQGRTILESTLFTIGSSPDNSLVLDNLKVSAHHAEIRSEEQGFTITDLGGIHGTYVNGERLDFNMPRLLNPGDSIAIEDMVFTYDVEETPQTEETPSTSPNQEGDAGAPSDGNEETPQTEETLSTSPNQEGDAGAPSDGNEETLPTSMAYAMDNISEPPEDQQPDDTPFIPADYDGPIPGYVPVEQVRRRNRRFLFIGLGLLVVIALAVGGYFYFTRSTPEKTLDAFCNAMQVQDYQTAYNQPSLAGGKVSACTHSSANATRNQTTAKVTLVTGSGLRSNTIVTLMADSGNTWKLSMLPTTPGMTLTAFCNALQSNNYPTAYLQLSSGIRRVHAEAQFETDFTGLTCSYGAVSPSGNTASTIVTFRNASGQMAKATVSLIQDVDSNNNWKIDGIQF